MRRIWVPQVIASLLLIWALNPANPYGYYILLRWVCCAIFVYLAFQALAQEKQGWIWVLGITAAVYNPIIPVRFNREIWSIINVVTIGIAVASIFGVKMKDEKNNTAIQAECRSCGDLADTAKGWTGPNCSFICQECIEIALCLLEEYRTKKN